MIRCIAVDDEPVALSIIDSFCKRYGNLELTTFTDPNAASKAIAETKPNLVFLDIEMNGISGISLAKSLPEKTLFIFTTAYANYALDGFELNAVDFLHKPFSFSRFEKAIDKTFKILNAKELERQADNDDKKITLKVEYKNVNVSLCDILYIEAMDNYVKVFKTNGSCIISQINLKRIQELLPEIEFIRVHKSYIIPLSKVLSYTKKQIVLNVNSVRIPVGRIYSDYVSELLEK